MNNQFNGENYFSANGMNPEGGNPNFNEDNNFLTHFINNPSFGFPSLPNMGPNLYNINVTLDAQKSLFKREGKSITYLNQNQQYEMSLEFPGSQDLGVRRLLTIVKLGFEERRMQIKRKEKFLQWFNEYQDYELFEIIGTKSSNIHNLQRYKSHRGKIQFEWDPSKPVNPLLKVFCLSSDFCENKSGGEEGIVLCLRITTYDITNQLYQLNASTLPVQKCSCNIKVFKMKGADRKLKQELARCQKDDGPLGQEIAQITQRYNEMKHQQEQALDLIKEKETILKKKIAEYQHNKEQKESELLRRKSELELQINQKQSELELRITQKQSELVQKKSELELQINQKQSELQLQLTQKESELMQRKSEVEAELSKKKYDIELSLDDHELDLKRQKTQIENEKRAIETAIHKSSSEMQLLETQLKILMDEHKNQYNNKSNKITEFEPDNLNLANSPDSSLELSFTENYESNPINTFQSMPGPVKRKQESELMAPLQKILKPNGIFLDKDSSPKSVIQWLDENNFSRLIEYFDGYSGEDLLSLEKADVLKICDVKDGIRLFNRLKKLNNPIQKEIFVEFKDIQTTKLFKTEFTSLSLNELTVDCLKREIQNKGKIMGCYIQDVYISKASGVNYMLTDNDVGQIRNQQAYFANFINRDPQNLQSLCLILTEVILQSQGANNPIY